MDTELLPLLGGASDAFVASIFFVPGVGMELLRVLDQGWRLVFPKAGTVVVMVGVGEVAVAVGTEGWQLGSAGESKLCQTLGLDTWSKCGCWWVGWLVGWLVGWWAKRQAGGTSEPGRQRPHVENTHAHSSSAQTERETMHGGGRGEKLGHSQKPKGLGQGQTKVKVIPDD